MQRQQITGRAKNARARESGDERRAGRRHRRANSCRFCRRSARLPARTTHRRFDQEKMSGLCLRRAPNSRSPRGQHVREREKTHTRAASSGAPSLGRRACSSCPRTAHTLHSHTHAHRHNKARSTSSVAHTLTTKQSPSAPPRGRSEFFSCLSSQGEPSASANWTAACAPDRGRCSLLACGAAWRR